MVCSLCAVGTEWCVYLMDGCPGLAPDVVRAELAPMARAAAPRVLEALASVRGSRPEAAAASPEENGMMD